jgi:hypothetical protein
MGTIIRARIGFGGLDVLEWAVDSTKLATARSPNAERQQDWAVVQVQPHGFTK